MTLALPKQIFKNLGYKNEIKVLFHFYETQNGVPLEVLPKKHLLRGFWQKFELPPTFWSIKSLSLI